MDQERAQSRSLDAPDEHRDLPRAGMDIIRLGDLLAVRATFQPGWRWSTDMGPRMGTTSCPVTHRGILLSGRMRVQMDSGEVLDVEPGSIQVIPAGHDAFVLGDEPAVMVDFSSSADEIGQASAGERIVSTLLFTDIVGSTQLAERLGDQQWKRLLAEHDRFLGEAVNRFRGRIVKTTGDGVFARFDGAARALHAAVAMVRHHRRARHRDPGRRPHGRGGARRGRCPRRGDPRGGPDHGARRRAARSSCRT